MQSLLKKLELLVINSRKSNIPELERGYETLITNSNCYLIHTELLNETLDMFFQTYKQIEETLSKQEVIGRLKNLVINSLINNNPLIKELVEDFHQCLKNDFPLQQWEIFRPLYGAKLLSNPSFELGNCKIFEYSEFKKLVEKGYDTELLSSMKLEGDSHLIIRAIASARDQKKARELADIKFHQFDNIVQYMLGNSPLHVAVFDYFGVNVSKTFYIADSTKQSMSYEIKGARDLVHIDDRIPILMNDISGIQLESLFPEPFFFTSISQGHNWIWDISKKLDPNDLEKRLISSIEWIGKSIRDSDRSRAFTQLVIAIESIFTYDERGALVTPSIASRISESVAFVLGKNLEERIQIVKQISDIYSKRSGIVHGGGKVISEKDLRETLLLVKKIVGEMTTNSKFVEMKTIQNFYEWIKEQKFS